MQFLRQQKPTPGGETVFKIAVETLHQLPYQNSKEKLIESNNTEPTL